MNWDTILPLILKVLGGAVVAYFIAGFLVSLTRLLPFLALLSAGGTFWAAYAIRQADNPDLLWLPIALTLLTQLFYKGEGFMNPKIHENVYNLVSIERKWKSIFKENDEYIFHFTPYETGGFIENTVLNGLFFWFYYSELLLLPNKGLVFIYPIYIMIISLLDILLTVRILPFIPFFYRIFRALILIFSITLGVFGPWEMPSPVRSEKAYEAYLELVKVDFNQSYKMSYDLSYLGSDDLYHTHTDSYFIYDSDLEAGAIYENKNWGTLYTTVFAKSANRNDGTARFQNIGGKDGNQFLYMYPAEEVGAPFKYYEMDAKSSFADYYEFTRNSFEHMMPSLRWERLQVRYDSSLDTGYDQENNLPYTVTWYFNVNEEKIAISLHQIVVKVQVNSMNIETWTYTPLTETELGSLFDEDGNLLDYTYNENDLCGVDMKEVFDSLNGNTGTIEDWDFRLEERCEELRNSYLYDCETEMAEFYLNRPKDAPTSSPPDFFLSNPERSLYDAEGTLLEQAASQDFTPFTYNNAGATRLIENLFAISMPSEGFTCTPIPYSDRYLISFRQVHPELEVEVTYYLTVAFYSTGRYLYDIYAVCLYEGKEYVTYAYRTDQYSISLPEEP